MIQALPESFVYGWCYRINRMQADNFHYRVLRVSSVHSVRNKMTESAGSLFLTECTEEASPYIVT
jgi:hypothetical protein